ncbi:hypothetical protein ACIBKX_16250 [Streptomyces sp. NPDC050658]|uniref:hypothetical protein n=1 Tax=unclassified Streptomyces TaxID=2593676 RepID=UPI0034186C4D
MPRNEKKSRRLAVDGNVYLWTVGHTHRALGDGRYEDCCEVLDIRLFRARGRLRVLFREGPDRLVPDGYLHAGAVGTAGGAFLNLHEPGTVRAFLDAALAQGWRPDDPPPLELDGWPLFEAAAARRRA